MNASPKRKQVEEDPEAPKRLCVSDAADDTKKPDEPEELDRTLPVIICYSNQDDGDASMSVVGPFFFVLKPETLTEQNWLDLNELLRWNRNDENSQDISGRRKKYTKKELCYKRLLSLVNDGVRVSVPYVMGVKAGALLSLTKWWLG